MEKAAGGNAIDQDDRIPIIPGSGLPNDIDVDFPGKSCSAEQGFFAGGRIHFP
jgi:hypothetical protein